MRSALLTLTMLALTSVSTAGAEFYVSTGGDDANPGTLDRPFATLARARDAVRAYKQEHGLPAGGIQVLLREGTYPLRETFALDERDSGAEGREVVFRPYQSEAVRLTGGIEIPAAEFRLVSDPEILRRLLPEARGKAVQVDLKALGITDYGEIGPRGFRRPYKPGPLELCCDGEVMQRARWPNVGQPLAKMGKIVRPGANLRNDDGALPVRYDSTDGGAFTCETDRLSRWTEARDLWLYGIFAWGFADDTVKVKRLDPALRLIETVHPAFYAYQAHRPYCGWVALNLLEEMDIPGEYALDHERGVLYFLPPVPLAGARLQVSMLKEPLVALEGASYVALERLTLECSRGTGVTIERGERNQVRGCTLRNLGIMGVQFGKGIEAALYYDETYTGKKVSRELGSWHEHVWSNSDFDSEAGRGHGVISCDIYNMGAGGVQLSGGNRVTLEPAGNYVLNCHLHHCGRFDSAYKTAVNLDGVGNRLAHCLINEHPNMAVYLQGNDQIIEYNDIFRNALQVDDLGAFYTGMDPTQLGSQIRYNYWHGNASGVSPEHTVIYFDSPGGHGATIEGNVFYDNACNWGDILLNVGAQCFQVHNNLFIGDRRALRAEPFTDAAESVQPFGGARAKLLQLVDLAKPPYSERYPGMANFRQPGWYDPRKNSVRRNLVVGCREFYTGTPEAEDNVVTETDPGFVDAANQDFTLRDDAPVLQRVPGFEAIPFSQIGLYRDEYRQALPLRAPRIECSKEFLAPGDTVTCRALQAGVELHYTLALTSSA